ncbi:hypothetical protein HDU87_001052 [Geranomyces variabilis]|uniref:DUF2423 domain-containing protein n=1 Tax=Geranomyces variabilis TaxID=109894 RepID=A0AAD5XU11_9FUNG|nr:hypothetical protein HDU87_001052 [Geranomyces variabilis]
MAKGLRSKSMRKNRSALRATVFGPVEDARLARLVQKEIAALATQDTTMAVEAPALQSPSEARGRDGVAGESEEDVTPGNGGAGAMEVDGDAAPSSAATTEASKPMSKSEKEKLFLSRNAYKKKMKARAKSAGKKWSYAKQR